MLWGMTRRTYRIALTGSITVDDETVKSAVVGMGAGDLDGIPPTEEELFEHGAGQVAIAGALSPEQLLQIFLVTGYFETCREAVVATLTRDFQGADVTVGGIDVNELEAGEQ